MPILCFARKQILILFFFSIVFSVLFWCWFSVFLLALNYFPTYWVGCFLLDFGVCFFRGVLKALYLSVSLQRFEDSTFVFLHLYCFLSYCNLSLYIRVCHIYFLLLHDSSVHCLYGGFWTEVLDFDRVRLTSLFIYSLSLLWVYEDALTVFSKRLKLLFILHPSV